MRPAQLTESLAAANALLETHPLAAPRVVAVDGDLLVLEVHHCEGPPPALPAFGRLCFVEPSYVQMPLRLEWGMTLQLFDGDVANLLPSLSSGPIADAHVFVLRAHDGSNPPAFIVAAALRVETA